MANPGIAPASTTTDVGKVRHTIGDLTYVALVPPVTGQGNYTMFSDAEIEQFLELAGDSVLGASGYAYLSLSGSAAIESRNIADHDLKISTEKRAADLRAQAEFYLGLAGLTAGPEAFDIVPTGRRYTALELAELQAQEILDGNPDPQDFLF